MDTETGSSDAVEEVPFEVQKRENFNTLVVLEFKRDVKKSTVEWLLSKIHTSRIQGGKGIQAYPVLDKDKQVKVTDNHLFSNTVEPLLRVHPDERTTLLERPLVNVNLNITDLKITPNERPPFLKGHFSDGKRVAPQEGFHCTFIK